MGIKASFNRYDPPTEITKRDDIIYSYVDNQVNFLKTKYPNVSEDKLRDIVKKIVLDKIKLIKAQVIEYPQIGDAKLVEKDLLGLTRKLNNKFIAPCGTFFESTNKSTGNSIEFINECNDNRSSAKKLMFKLLEEGKEHEADIMDSIQNLAKILTNALTGNHSFLGSPFYDLESYNGITSVGRNGTVMCYSIVEILLIGNYSFTSKEKAIEYVVNTTTYTKNVNKTKDVLNKHKWLHIPNNKEIIYELLKTMKYYVKKEEILDTNEYLNDYLDKLNTEQRVYLFYRHNLYNLFKYNKEVFDKFLDILFNLDENIDSKELPEIDKLPDDLAMMIAVIFSKTLEGKAFGSKLVKENPDIAKKYTLLANLVMDHIYKINDIFETFLYSGEFLPSIPDRQLMIRQVVPNSDTDSILYTVYNQVAWRTNGDLKVNQNSLNIAAFAIWILGNVLDAANYDMAIVRGCINENTRELYTKYEFLYPVFCKTDLGKHYFGLQLYREGHKQDPPKLDVKGVAFQTSNLPQVSRKFSKDFLELILKLFAENGNIDIVYLIEHCIKYEKQIIDSLMNGELTYYGNIAIKGSDEYKDATKSIFFNYLMWEEVYADRYDHIKLPGKFILLPLKVNTFKSDKYLKYIESYDSETYDKLIKYLERIKKEYPSKKITRIPIPITLTKLPKIFLPAIDMRKIVYKSMAPSQLALEQLGLHLGDSKKMPLLHDFYSDLNIDNLNID